LIWGCKGSFVESELNNPNYPKFSVADLEKLSSKWINSYTTNIKISDLDSKDTFWGTVQVDLGSNFELKSLSKFQKNTDYLIGSEKSKFPFYNVLDIVIFNDKVWLGTESGIFSIKENDTTKYEQFGKKISLVHVNKIRIINNELYCLAKGAIISNKISYFSEIFKFENDIWKSIAVFEDDKVIDFNIFKNNLYLLKDKDVIIYDLSNNNFVIHSKNGQNNFEQIEIDTKGGIWIRNWWGLVKY
jgi:hypothetical protein